MSSRVSQFINRPFLFLSSRKSKNKSFVCEILEIPDDRNRVKSKVHTLHRKNADEMFCLSRNYTFNNDYFRLIESNYVTSRLYKKNYFRSVDFLIHFTNFSQSQEINKIKVFKQFLSMLSDLLLKVELNFINAEIFRSYNKKSVKTRNPC